MRIAVDAVGGDHYPQNPVAGSIQAIQENDDLTIILVGPQELIKKELANYEYDEKRIVIQDAPEIIGMDEAPGKAVKTKQNSSIVVGLGLHKKGYCDAFVSAGNTGALLAASMFILGKLEGVMRPTIAAIYPTVKGFRLLIDAGANLEPKPEVLYQFGLMGRIYARNILGIEEPRIGLMNVGEEEEKGTEVLQQANQLMKGLPNFVGNIEGRDVLAGNADVFVCDGLVGNILLKFGESIATQLQTIIGSAIAKNNLDDAQKALVVKILRDALSQFDYQMYGGVPFLGVDGVSLVGHGSSSPLAIKNMIFSAAQVVDKQVNSKIVASLNN